MSNLLQQLDEQSMLLMYANDELPEADRAEVEQRLAHDPALSARLAELSSAQERIFSGLGRLDAKTPLAISQAVAVREVSRAMRQAMAERAAASVDDKPKWGLRYPWWAYPSAAAAAILIAWLVYWGNSPDNAAQLATNAPATQTDKWLIDDDSAVQQVADRLQQSFDGQAEASAPLIKAEGDAYALSQEAIPGESLNEELINNQ